MIEWHDDFTSSNVNRLGFDPGPGECYVEFKNKAGDVTSTWAYGPMTWEDFEVIHHADSVGGAVNKFLVRGGIYSSRKIS